MYYPFSEADIVKYSAIIEWGVVDANNHKHGICSNLEITWNESLITKFHDKIDFTGLLLNESFNWDVHKIDKYKNNIDWEFGIYYLARNSAINWTYELIEYLISEKIVGLNELSNLIIPWNKELLSRLKNEIDWRGLCVEESVIWNIELVNEFQNFIP